MKKIYAVCIVILFAACTVGAVTVLEIRLFAENPIGPEFIEKKVAIDPGKSFHALVGELKDDGLLKNPLKFRILARVTGADKKIKAGEYLISGGLTPTRILEKLVRGDVILYRLTIPEGYSADQIAEMVEHMGWGARTQFLSLASDKAFIKSLGIDAGFLEGYLFPDTYFFPRNTATKQIIAAMTGRFNSVFTPAWGKRAQELGFTVHQIITLASIIEKETGDPGERPLIASVFHNRLKLGMRLESDPTVIYGLENFNGNITRKDLHTPTPYNTYVIFGLPPGPIANPGQKSLEAALYPKDSEFLYFVSKNDGTHQFSTNFSDHTLAVRKYQLSPKNSEVKTRNPE